MSYLELRCQTHDANFASPAAVPQSGGKKAPRSGLIYNFLLTEILFVFLK